MSKERLEEIKDNKTYLEGTNELIIAINTDDYDWLTEQAERVQELEGTVKHAMKAIGSTEAVRVKLINAEQQNKRYREAIEKAISILKNVPSESTPKMLAVEALIKSLEEYK